MKSTNKVLFIFILVFAFVCSCPFFASANAPMPADHLTVELSDLPSDAVYADLLIKIDESDANYTSFQSNDFADDVEQVRRIAEYSVDGYRSFTFHYKNAKSNIELEQTPYGYSVDFCKGSEYQSFLTQYEDICINYRKVKIAILDKNFDILSVSQEATLPTSKALSFYGDISYNGTDNSLEAITHVNPYYIVFGGFFSLLIIFISISTEFIISLFFRIRGKRLLTILIVNVSSQIIMRLLYAALPLSYIVETLILEALVYSVEFLIYNKCFKDISTGRVVAYTVTANTVSLLLGILLDCFILA